MNIGHTNKLRRAPVFSLFCLSYMPFFLILAVRQINENISFLIWGGISMESFVCFARCFLLSILAISLSLYGAIGSYFTMRNLRSSSPNGVYVYIVDVENKNSESLGYLATYIIPFLFQSFNGILDQILLVGLLVMIYSIYIRSDLMVINPILNIWYSIYAIEFTQGSTRRKGMVIMPTKELEGNRKLKIYEIGYKLYISTQK